MRTTESNEQRTLFKWASLMQSKYPQLRLMHHIPNGGKRDKITAARLKAEGVKAGVPDIFLPIPKGNAHGLYIELKVGKNRCTRAQEAFIKDVKALGYVAEVCYGWEEASRAIERYLKAN